MAKVAKGASQPAGKGAQKDWFLEDEEKRAAPVSAAPSGAAGSTQAYRSEAARVNDESSASLQRSLAMVHQTNAVAEDTIIELDKQGRKIEKMERDMEIIEDNNKQAERHVRGLKSVFGRIANKFSKNTSYREESEVEPRQSTESAKQINLQSRTQLQPGTSAAGGSSADLLQGDDPETMRLKQQMKQQNQDLDEIHSGARARVLVAYVWAQTDRLRASHGAAARHGAGHEHRD